MGGRVQRSRARCQRKGKKEVKHAKLRRVARFPKLRLRPYFCRVLSCAVARAAPTRRDRFFVRWPQRGVVWCATRLEATRRFRGNAALYSLRKTIVSQETRTNLVTPFTRFLNSSFVIFSCDANVFLFRRRCFDVKCVKVMLRRA